MSLNLTSNMTIGVAFPALLDAIDPNEKVPLENKKATLYGVAISFMLAAWLCVCFRLYTRVLVVRSVGWDDFFISIAILLTTSGTLSLLAGVNTGLGHHMAELTFEDFYDYVAAFYVMNGSYTLATAAIKLSLLFQFLRFFDRAPVQRRICYVLIVFVFLWTAAFGFFAWFPCFPVHMLWDKSLFSTAPVHCYGYGALTGGEFADTSEFVDTFESHSAINMVLDLLILAIPIPLSFNKHASPKTKLGLAALLLLGAVVNFFSIWRFHTVVQHQAGSYPILDPTWWGPVTILLADLEIDLACICASIPVFWPVLEKSFGIIFITQEVKITHEDRWGHSGQDEEQSELTGMALQGLTTTDSSLGDASSKNGACGRHLQQHSRSGSCSELKKIESVVRTRSAADGVHCGYDFMIGDEIDSFKRHDVHVGVSPDLAAKVAVPRGKEWWRLV